MKSFKPFVVIVCGVATAVLVYFGTGLHPIWPLLWLAPVPIISIALGLPASRAFAIATGAWFFGQMNLWKHLAYGIGLSWPLIVVSFLMSSVAFALGVLFVRSFLRRGSIFLAALAFPCYWVSFEFLSATVSPHSTYGNLAYTQMNFLPLIQIASLTGIWGISFAVFLFAASVGTLASGIGKPQRRLALAVTVGMMGCSVLLFGSWRLRSKSPAQSVAVTLIAKDVPMSVYLGSEQQALKLLGDYAGEVRRAKPLGTDVVVLPEKIGRVRKNVLPELDALFSSLANETHAAIDLGLVRRTASGAFNSSRFYAPTKSN